MQVTAIVAAIVLVGAVVGLAGRNTVEPTVEPTAPPPRPKIVDVPAPAVPQRSRNVSEPPARVSRDGAAWIEHTGCGYRVRDPGTRFALLPTTAIQAAWTFQDPAGPMMIIQHMVTRWPSIETTHQAALDGFLDSLRKRNPDIEPVRTSPTSARGMFGAFVWRVDAHALGAVDAQRHLAVVLIAMGPDDDELARVLDSYQRIEP